jgi:carbon starvation protein
MKRLASILFWSLAAVAGAGSLGALALHRGETVNSVWMLIAAICTYVIGYRFYSRWLATRVLFLNERRATPCEVHEDGRDYVKTDKWIVFGHHFAAISGPGPLVGPVLAAQFGYLPGTLWILIGVVLAGAVQDFVILFASLRRDGKSLGQMVKEELNTTAGHIAMVSILAILVILLAVLGLVVVKALAESPWGVFTVGSTIPIALFMGCYLRFWRQGRVREASAIGIICLLLAVWGGKMVYQSPVLSQWLAFKDITLAWSIILYGLAASVLPVWLLLAPRDYLSTFMKLGTIFALAAGIVLILPDLKMPAINPAFLDGSGPIVAGKIFPFCFISIACGAISGFHALIASGTTPKILTRESYARPIGYGAMLLESLVAIMAMIAACALAPGIYLCMNIKGEAATTVASVTAMGWPVTVEDMNVLAGQMGEHSLFGRTGGAATLAVGMAKIFSTLVKGYGLDLWYHFAIMFEALFILTTIDAGTRVARYILHDFLGHFWKPLGDARHVGANFVASSLMVGAWGTFLIQGVRDPLGGINSLWPLFGIANQMLAAIALCVATTILLKMHLRTHEPDVDGPVPRRGRPALALVTLIPLVWLLAVTFTAGVDKICSSDARIGFLAQTKALEKQRPALQTALDSAVASGNSPAIAAAKKDLEKNGALRFNNRLNATVAAVFLGLTSVIVLISIREWWLLLSRRKSSQLHESNPVWLPAYLVAAKKASALWSLLPLGLALLREWSGESEIDRHQQREAMSCKCHSGSEMTSRGKAYAQTAEARFNCIRRCC